MSPDRGTGIDRAEALLKEAVITEAQQREAGINLAGLALKAAGGDPEAAKPMLREVLEAVGALWYPVPPGKKQFGHRQGEAQ